MSAGDPGWTEVVIAFLGAQGLNWGTGVYRDWRKGRSNPGPRTTRRAAEIDANILTVTKARDELEEDNARLRLQLSEAEDRHARARDAWEQREARMRDEIEQLESRLRALLEEVMALKSRHGVNPTSQYDNDLGL